MDSPVVLVSTWRHLKGNCCMISNQIDSHSSFAPVRLIPSTLRPILPASSCICISRSDCLVLSAYNFVQWNQSVTPSVSHVCTKLGVECWISGHCCNSARNETQPWKLYSATLGGYLFHFSPCAHPNRLPVSCSLAFPFLSPLKSCLHIFSNTLPPIVAECIQHYRNFPMAARSWKSPKYLQPLSPSTGVHLAAVSDGSVPG